MIPLVMTGASDESTTLRSGRRLDDSVFEADDQHKYEGSLMKLTARPLHEDPSTDVTDDTEMADVSKNSHFLFFFFCGSRYLLPSTNPYHSRWC